MAEPKVGKVSKQDKLRSLMGQYGIGIVILIMTIVIAIMEPRFLTGSNIMNVAMQITINGLLCYGLCLAITTGGIDLTVGAQLALTSCIIGHLMTNLGVPWFLSVLAGVLVHVLKGKLNGNGALMQAGMVDVKELEISPEMQKKRDEITAFNLGIGLLVSGAFFSFGYIVQGAWNALNTGITIHAYAWMIITVAAFKVADIVPEWIEIACFQWFQFIMKNLTNVLLMGIGVCYLEISTVISSFSITYLLLCLATCVGAFTGAAFVGRLVGFYPFEAGITAGLCMSNMGGTGDVAVLSAADRMELMPFAQISSRLGGAVILLIASLMLSVLAQFL